MPKLPYEDQCLKAIEDFDPNAKPAHSWATFVPFRGFKVHAGRGTALNAISYHARTGGILYRWDTLDNAWVEVWRHDRLQKPHVCDLCPAPALLTADGSNRLRWQWIFKKTPKPEYRALCPVCAGGMKNS